MKVKGQANATTRTEMNHRSCLGFQIEDSKRAWFSVYAGMESGSGTGNPYCFVSLDKLKELRRDLNFIINQMEKCS